MSHPLFVAVARTTGMRQLAALAVRGRVYDAIPSARVSVALGGNVLEVSVALPRRALWWLGLAHLRAWWRARWAARQALGECKTDVLLRRVRPWNIRTSASSFPASIQRFGASCETR